jgi:hypothetical protein
MLLYSKIVKRRIIERHRRRLKDNIKRDLKDSNSNKCAKFKYTPLVPE